MYLSTKGRVTLENDILLDTHFNNDVNDLCMTYQLPYMYIILLSNYFLNYFFDNFFLKRQVLHYITYLFTFLSFTELEFMTSQSMSHLYIVRLQVI